MRSFWHCEDGETYRSEDLEECRLHLPSNLASCQSIRSQREGETPPTDVEGELLASEDRCQRKEQPDQSEGPEYKGHHEAEDVDGGNSRRVSEDRGCLECISG